MTSLDTRISHHRSFSNPTSNHGRSIAHKTSYDTRPVTTINNNAMNTVSAFNSVSNDAYKVVTTGTANLTRFGKTVTTIASTLYSGDLTGSTGSNANGSFNYAESMKDSIKVMRDISKTPAFKKRFFNFSKKPPSEVMRNALGESKEEIQYKALTKIPEELLLHIPPSFSNFSLFQGFQAIEETTQLAMLRRSNCVDNKDNISDLKQLTDGPTSSKPTRKKISKDIRDIDHTLDLLEIRKDLAANEINEIDQKIAYLRSNRNHVFERVAKLEQEEFALENKLKYLNMQSEMLSDDDSEGEELTDSNIKTFSKDGKSKKTNQLNNTSPREENNGNELLSQSIFGKLEKQSKLDKSKKTLNRLPNARKTQPTLQQYYNTGDNIRILQAHTSNVTCLDFDIPFGTMVSASVDDTCKVWDLGRGTCKGELKGHNAYVTSLHMESNLVATGSMDATVRLWDLSLLDFGDSDTSGDDDEGGSLKKPAHGADNENYCVETFEAHVREVNAIYFHQDTLVTGSADKTIRQWDLRSGRCLQTLDVLWATAMTSNTQFAESGDAWQGHLGNLGHSRINNPMGVPKPASNAPFVGALQVFDAALASGTADGVVRLWDLRSGQPQRSLIGHTGPVTCLQFDDRYLTTGSMDHSIRVWDLRTGSIVDAFAYESPITSLHFDSRRIISANGENTVKIYDRKTGKHWTCGPGAASFNQTMDDLDSQQQSAISSEEEEHINIATFKEGYLVEGRASGIIGTWAC